MVEDEADAAVDDVPVALREELEPDVPDELRVESEERDGELEGVCAETEATSAVEAQQIRASFKLGV